MSNTFLHAGTFGDTILGLNAIKILGGGDLYIELNGMDRVAQDMWGGGDAGDHSGRYTQSDLDFLWPLLELQPYVNNLNVWNNEPIKYDLRKHYRFWARRNGKSEDWAGNATECYALACGLDIHQYKRELLIDPWLTVGDPIKIPNRPIVINRTCRHIKRDHNIQNEQWVTWLEGSNLAETCVFVGSEKEHEDFCRIYNCKVEYCPVKDMLEMARIIAGSEQFIGNQSMAVTLAIALGKTYWCEVRLDYENTKTPHGGYGDAWFPRANGNYF